jgi:ATP-binding cassette subfamily B multidrug efflux pump
LTTPSEAPTSARGELLDEAGLIKERAAETVPDAGSRTEKILKEFHEESTLGKAYDSRLMARLWPFVRPYKGLLSVALAVVVVTAAGALARPLIMLDTIDRGVLAGDGAVLLKGGLLLAAIVVVEQLLGFIQIYILQVVGARSMADLRRHVFEFLHGLRVGYFDRQPVGRLVTRVTNDVDAILELFASGSLNAFGDLIRLVGILIFMLALDYKLALIGFAATPPVALLVAVVRRRSREAFREIRAKTARMNATMNEQVSGMTVVQAFGKQDLAGGEFDAINAAYRDANLRAIKYEAMQDAAIETVSAIGLASIIVALGYRPVSFGTVVAFSAYLSQFFEPISMLAQRYTLLQSAMAGAERVFSLLDVEARDAPRRTPAEPAAVAAEALSFEHVTFSYKPGLPVLRDVSFSARRGEKIALVGPTGSGKTTVTALLLRLYDANEGVVRVEGLDVGGMAREELRRRFAMVPQDVFLFPGTIASNVAAGEKPDEARVTEVLKRIGAYDLFARREGGIFARVDEHGANFSAGERQLIAFARALYRDAGILILDEATASVDSDTEARLQRALEELLEGRTALIIAHRLSTIRAADRIIVLHRGRIVEQGSHAELIAAEGLYARLYELQFSRDVAQRVEDEVTAHSASSLPASAE